MILGTGGISHRHAEHFTSIPGCRIVAACDVNADRSRTFADMHAIPRSFDNLGKALEWGEFDAVVNSTPDGVHKATTLDILAAGKAVFCEKPLAVNADDAFDMVEAVEKAGVINMVNLTYRNAHAIQMARRLIDAGEIGAVRHVEASYLQSWLTGRHWGDWRVDERWLWRLSSAHGSMGVLGDIGIHIVDFVTYGTGLDIAALQARLKTFDKAEGGAIGGYTLDANDSCAMTVEFTNGALGVIHMSRFATGKANDLDLTIHGELGALKIWSNTTESSLQVCLGADIETQTWRPYDCPPTPRNADRFVIALLSGTNGEPDFRRAAEVQKILDLCFVSDAERRMLPVELPPAD
ncbi:Gfo/Idh/MocA family protein [Aurantimonas sp. VKM B-3413]|uniref:Gfo/Idh/MocA family protein n=1 Tax=Aurantimonas sp. VKM B-3413 TaxID=2779401 RepID=UPI001E2B40ED|nr:Gfo/Idh/MocA family oxidoreductase [Aurantimonas sp. VKM B-3413]MCB8839059.1 Gfo/Idh/MocA family oxidoreductase [Aurantimonas sp. VKM B-3413]